MNRSAIVLCIFLIPMMLRCEGLYRVEHITSEQGLSQSIVYAVLQDSRGLLWFGTRDGLNMYDGLQFTPFRHQPHDTSSLPANAALDVGEDRNGNIWVALGSWGIARLDRRTYRFQRYLLEDLQRRSLHGSTARVLLKDPRGGLLIGTDDGLFRFDPNAGRCERIVYERNMVRGESALIISLYEDRQGFLWIGTMGKRFYRYDMRKGGVISYPADPVGIEGIRFIGEDRGGALYMATDVPGGIAPCLWRLNPADGSIVGRLTVRSKGYAIPYHVNDGKNIWIAVKEGASGSTALYSIATGWGVCGWEPMRD